MSEEELLKIIVSDKHPEVDRPLSEITRMLAKSISSVAHKLEDDELSEFLCIAVALYQKGFHEFKAGVEAENVLYEMRAKNQP